ncbi:MAG: molybdopterin molybdotransferase MoeA [Acidobacteria bacterium]|nr:molybdopterin molybdotransferase MoeA [Acidobacteriota bacterium]
MTNPKTRDARGRLNAEAAPAEPGAGTGILSFEEARRAVEGEASRVRSKRRERAGLLDAVGRVLAEPILADRDFPPFPRATRDGYAVRAEDLRKTPAELELVGEARAGGAPPAELVEHGQAVEIMTGAPLPQGADAVVMIEHTAREGNRVRVECGVRPEENVVPAGREARRGEELVSPGARLSYPEVALAASVGRSRLLVYAKPRVAVLSTGDEVVDIEAGPAANQIRNSNAYSLAAQIQAAGGEPTILPVAPDEPVRLRELLLQGLDSDLLLVSGGVSMGKYDLVEPVLAELKAELFFTGVQIQPGKPVVFGRIPHPEERPAPGDVEPYRYFFGLPGNPVSTMITFELFAKPIVQALAGISPLPLVFTHARLKSAIRTRTGLKRFLPALISGRFDDIQVEPVLWHGSGDICSVARSNSFVVIPADRERIEAGEWVPVLLR